MYFCTLILQNHLHTPNLLIPHLPQHPHMHLLQLHLHILRSHMVHPKHQHILLNHMVHPKHQHIQYRILIHPRHQLMLYHLSNHHHLKKHMVHLRHHLMLLRNHPIHRQPSKNSPLMHIKVQNLCIPPPRQQQRQQQQRRPQQQRPQQLIKYTLLYHHFPTHLHHHMVTHLLVISILIFLTNLQRKKNLHIIHQLIIFLKLAAILIQRN